MIVKLKGFIEDWFEDFVDLDVKGVVYRVFVPQKNINRISEKGSLVTFFIFEILKESERLFFGFSNKTFAFGLLSIASFLPKPQFDKNKSKTKYIKNLFTEICT